jgi:hypothetical protein
MNKSQRIYLEIRGEGGPIENILWLWVCGNSSLYGNLNIVTPTQCKDCWKYTGHLQKLRKPGKIIMWGDNVYLLSWSSWNRQMSLRGSNRDLSGTEMKSICFYIPALMTLLMIRMFCSCYVCSIRYNSQSCSRPYITIHYRISRSAIWVRFLIPWVCLLRSLPTLQVFKLLASGGPISTTLYSTWLNDPSTKLCYQLHYCCRNRQVAWAVSSE